MTRDDQTQSGNHSLNSNGLGRNYASSSKKFQHVFMHYMKPCKINWPCNFPNLILSKETNFDKKSLRILWVYIYHQKKKKERENSVGVCVRERERERERDSESL